MSKWARGTFGGLLVSKGNKWRKWWIAAVALAMLASGVTALVVTRQAAVAPPAPPTQMTASPSATSASPGSTSPEPTASKMPSSRGEVVKFKGACDGRTDDTDALTAALKQLEGRGGGVLELPKGVCRVASTGQASGIRLGDSITIRGAGRDQSVLRFTPASAGFTTLFDVAGDHVALSALSITRATDSQSVMFNVFASHFSLVNVKLDGGRPSTGQTSHGIQIVGGNGDITDLLISNSVITGCDYGLFQANAATTVVRGITVEDSTFVNNVADDLEFNAPSGRMSDVTVRRSQFRDNLYDSDSGSAGIGVGLANVSGAVVEDSVFDGYWWAPVHIEDRSADIVVRRNRFSNVFKKQRDWTSAIFIVSGSTRILITGNHIDLGGSGSPAAAVYVGSGGGDSAPKDVQLVDNVIASRPGDQFVSAHGSRVTEAGNRYG